MPARIFVYIYANSDIARMMTMATRSFMFDLDTAASVFNLYKGCELMLVQYLNA